MVQTRSRLLGQRVRIVLSYATEFDFHEGHQIARALIELGHNVTVVNTTIAGATRYWPQTATFAPDTELEDIVGKRGTDLFLYIEPRGLLARGLERAACRTACILADTMFSLPPRRDLSRLFDDVLLYSPHALELLPHDRARVHWVPLGIDPKLFDERGAARDLDVACVGSSGGHWRSRDRLLAAIAARYKTNDFFEPRPFEEIPGLYSRARIVIHIPIADALGTRIFEAMACGALLICGRVTGLDELFMDGRHLVVYENEQQALEQIDYYLRHDDQRSRIARAGHDEVHRAHTYAHRFRAVLATLATLPRGTAPARTMPAEQVEDIYQRRHKQAGQADALLRRALAAPPLSAARYRALARAARTYVARLQNRMRAPN